MSRSAGEIMALLIMAVCTIVKALHGFKEKRVHKTRHMQFRMLKMKFLRFWKCLNTIRNQPEQPVQLTQNYIIETKTPHSWFTYFVTIVGHYYGIIIKGF